MEILISTLIYVAEFWIQFIQILLIELFVLKSFWNKIKFKHPKIGKIYVYQFSNIIFLQICDINLVSSSKMH